MDELNRAERVAQTLATYRTLAAGQPQQTNSGASLGHRLAIALDEEPDNLPSPLERADFEALYRRRLAGQPIEVTEQLVARWRAVSAAHVQSETAFTCLACRQPHPCAWRLGADAGLVAAGGS